jgi:glycosyltransferase involved in cell wall biosynthesis
MAEEQTRVLMVATSYPRDKADWQGLFIRKIADAMGADPGLKVSLWAPDGPRHARVDYASNMADQQWLEGLALRGGIAHLLRASPVSALGAATSLLRRLRALYRQRVATTDLFHINWLQNALPLRGMGARAVITVLGTDFKLLRLPGMVPLVRQVLTSNDCILAPNAAWMEAPLRQHFGDLAAVEPVNFGIDKAWYQVQCQAPGPVNRWLCVLRVTEDKIGRLFAWGEQVFDQQQQLHLVGPNQDGLVIPDWVHYHGALPASELLNTWYPGSCGFVTLSEHSEGKPQVLLETLAAGMPVIASRIPAHEETIMQGEQGFLVDSATQMKEALRQLSDAGVHQRLSRNCREASAGVYGTWEDCVARYRGLYRKLL